MDKVNLIYKLNGYGIDEGIDVFQLSPILLSFGKLIKEAHQAIYPEHKEIAVNIKPFQKGSFEIEIAMFAKTSYHQLLDLIKSTKGQDIKQLLDFLGLIITPTCSVMALVIALKGRTKSIERLSTGDYKYTAEDNLSLTVNLNVHKLYLNPIIQESIYNSIARPLETEGIESIESYLKNDEKKTKAIFNKDTAGPIRKYFETPLPELEDLKTIQNIRNLWVHPKRISLEGERHHWSVRIGGSDEVKTVNISDENFLNKVKEGDIRLAQSDKLLVDLMEKQLIRGDAPISVTYEIIEVKDYVKSPEPGRLIFEEE